MGTVEKSGNSAHPLMRRLDELLARAGAKRDAARLVFVAPAAATKIILARSASAGLSNCDYPN
jgi:hypothetical protein